MNSPVDLEQVVTAWLRNEASASGSDRVLAAALSRASTVRQERRRPRWFRFPTNPQMKVAMVATTVLVVVAGFGLLSGSRGNGPASGVGTRPSPSPTLSPTPSEAAYPPGYEIPPADRQSLTVDGVPLSFSVPAEGWAPGILPNPDGTAAPGSLYIGKDIVHGQAAEGVIFWTAFPDGASTDPCANVLGAYVGLSAADLAAAVATAPGTDLVFGPSDVTLGGLTAKRVALKVREDRGCDPGYFFTWPGECWGACWVATGVGTMIDVWVVDVDGKRLVVEAETMTRERDSRLLPETQQVLQSTLESEVQQIVESIRLG